MVTVTEVELDQNRIFDAVTPAIPMPLLVYVIVPLRAPFDVGAAEVMKSQRAVLKWKRCGYRMP